MKNLAEIIFDSSYLILIISMVVAMIIKSRNRKLILLFGIMAFVLGIGDSFHLITRIYALSTDGLQNHKQLLSLGTFVASISMTVFLCNSISYCKNQVLIPRKTISLMDLYFGSTKDTSLYMSRKWLAG